MIYLRPPEVQF